MLPWRKMRATGTAVELGMWLLFAMLMHATGRGDLHSLVWSSEACSRLLRSLGDSTLFFSRYFAYSTTG
jgi:hypothetical protein